jgi:hypothetical protein
MGSPALADFLPDFAARPRAAAVMPSIAPSRVDLPKLQPLPEPPDVDALIAEAVGRAEADLATRLAAMYDERTAEDRERHEAELAALRATLAVEFGARIAAELAELEKRAVEAATSVTARILGQIVNDEVSVRAVAALARSIRDAIADSDTIRISVRGPQSLFMPLAAAMGDQARHLEFVEAEGYDLHVALDGTLFETRVAEWSAALAGAIS